MRVNVTIDDGTTVEEFEAKVTFKNHKLSVKPDQSGMTHYLGYIDDVDQESINFIGSIGTSSPTLQIMLVPICEDTKKPPKLNSTLQKLIDDTRALLESIVSKLKGWKDRGKD